MSYSISKVPHPLNEPVLSYAPESLEKEEVLKMYNSLYNKIIDIPMRIGNKLDSHWASIQLHYPS